MGDIKIGLDALMRQTGATADYYFMSACDILERFGRPWAVKDAIELSKVMAHDMHSSMLGLKMQEIRDALCGISESIESVSDSIDNIEG